MLTEKQAEQLRKMSYVTRDSQSAIIRYMFDNYINTPAKPIIKKTQEKND